VNSSELKSLVKVAYDADLTQQCGTVLVDALTEHLGRVQSAQGPVQRWRAPEENITEAIRWLEGAEFLDSQSVVSKFQELVQLSLMRGQNLNHPRCVGHQVPAPLPLVGLFDAVTTMTNQVQGVYEMGPWGIAAERAVIQQIGKQIGYQNDEFGGLVTSGGSLGNLTALLAARNEACPWIWNDGNRPHESNEKLRSSDSQGDTSERDQSAMRPEVNSSAARIVRRSHMPVLIVHGDAHYCIDRAAGVMGIGQSQVMRVPLDGHRRMDVAALEQLLADLTAQQVPIIAVVAVACTTAVGVFDPLDAIADVCERHQVWLHVDAAHGGAVCLSQKHRHLIKGLERADSVVFDAHKMMFVPAVCALVFYRNKKNRFRAFEQKAPYLFDPSAPDMSEYDNGVVTFECTKRSAALGLWGALSIFGFELFEQLVDRVFLVAQNLFDLLDDAKEFEVVGEPQANIVVFRYFPEGVQRDENLASDECKLKVSQLQLRLRRAMLESGFGYLTQTALQDQIYLRCTIMNPLTEVSHLAELLAELRRLGPTLWSELQ
jgi:L-2,4-diaminobutyrate decarboxylase